MKEIVGDLWDHYPQHIVVITTNGFVKKSGECIMGRGCALEAKNRFTGIDKQLGGLIKEYGNHVHYLGKNLVSFPVKHNWWETAALKLIERSAQELATLADRMGWKSIVIPRTGCGNGKLKWPDVKPILEKHLDDRFMVISWKRK